MKPRQPVCAAFAASLVVSLVALSADSGSTAAVSGAQVWKARDKGTGSGGIDEARSLAVSRDGKRVFVTGYSYGGKTGFDFATVAYDAATGAKLWLARFGSGSGNEYGNSLTVSGDGKRVFVTGVSRGSRQDGAGDYATVAYDAATGAPALARTL